MPRTKSTKLDTRTPVEKLDRLKSKIDYLIFFEYHDGFRTEGVQGFATTDKAKIGCVKHFEKHTLIKAVLTKAQFAGKARKLALLAKEFICGGMTPAADKRPVFEAEELNRMLLQASKTETSMEKLAKVQSRMGEVEWRIFFLYYDGFVSRGDYGFTPRETIGSVIHRSAWINYFGHLSDSQWRYRAAMYGKLAQDFFEAGTIPPQHFRPAELPRSIPCGLIEAERRGGF